MSPQSLCAPLICPKLLHLTLSLLPTPWKLKLSTDGTYRLLFDQYALLTVGVNVKNYSKRKSANLHTFRSSFLPLAFAVANVEDGEAYTHFLQTCLEVAQTVGLRLEAKHILQFHGDLHKGIEKARVAVFPQSHRLSDWAHVTGVTSQGPNGLHGFLSQSLGDNTELSRFTLQWCRISKHMTLHLFHEIWTKIFCRLEDCGHGAMLKTMKKQYFHQVTIADGCKLWSAPWRSGIDRIMPGTDVGSAPQESWHGQTLKPAFVRERYEPFELAHNLQVAIVNPQLKTLQDMSIDGSSYEDWPAVGQFIDQHILRNAKALEKDGRADPKTLLALNLHQIYDDNHGSTWMLVPKSTLKVDWSKSGKRRAFKQRIFQTLPPDAVKAFARMVQAKSSAEIKEGWTALQLCQQGELDWKAAAKAFDDWTLVLSGQSARQFWGLHGTPVVDAQRQNLHGLHLCFLCSVSSRWGPCEHMYSLMLHQNHINESQVPKPKPKSRPKKSHGGPAPPPALHLQPGCASEPRPILPPAAPRDPPELLPDQVALRNILRKAGCGHLYPAMQQQGATIAALRSFTFTDFSAIFSVNVGLAHNKLMQLLAEARWLTIGKLIASL